MGYSKPQRPIEVARPCNGYAKATATTVPRPCPKSAPFKQSIGRYGDYPDFDIMVGGVQHEAPYRHKLGGAGARGGRMCAARAVYFKRSNARIRGFQGPQNGQALYSKARIGTPRGIVTRSASRRTHMPLTTRTRISSRRRGTFASSQASSAARDATLSTARLHNRARCLAVSRARRNGSRTLAECRAKPIPSATTRHSGASRRGPTRSARRCASWGNRTGGATPTPWLRWTSKRAPSSSGQAAGSLPTFRQLRAAITFTSKAIWRKWTPPGSGRSITTRNHSISSQTSLCQRRHQRRRRHPGRQRRRQRRSQRDLFWSRWLARCAAHVRRGLARALCGAAAQCSRQGA